MSPLAIASLFFLKLPVGVLASLLLVPYGGHWKGYFRLMGAISAVLLLVYLLLRGSLGERIEGPSAWLGWAVLLLALAHVAVSILGRGRWVTALEGAAALVGLAAVCASEAAASSAVESDPAWALWALPVLGVLSSLFLGTAMAAMLLGHWYLVSPQLPIAPLNRLCIAVTGTIVVLMLGAGVSAAAGWERLSPPAGTEALDHIVDVGVFVFPRFLVGGACIVFAWLAWRCARIRSTQSATGILYAVVACSLIAELLAAYGYAVTGVPL